MISMQPEVIEFLKYVSDATDLDQLRQELFGNKRFSKVLEACSDTSHVSILSEVVFQRLTDLQKAQEWDEFKSRPCADWKRVRAAIEHENNLTNRRLTWLFASQLIIFGGFFTLIQSIITNDPQLLEQQLFQSLLIAFPLVGISLGLIILVGLHAANKQIEFLENWWFCNHIEDVDAVRGGRWMLFSDQPPINGIFDTRFYHIFGTKWLPLPIIVAWTWIASAFWLHKILRVQQPVGLSIILTICLGLVGFILWTQLQKSAGLKRWNQLADLKRNDGTKHRTSPSSGQAVIRT
jgi:hypothetical protein